MRQRFVYLWKAVCNQAQIFKICCFSLGRSSLQRQSRTLNDECGLFFRGRNWIGAVANQRYWNQGVYLVEDEMSPFITHPRDALPYSVKIAKVVLYYHILVNAQKQNNLNCSLLSGFWWCRTWMILCVIKVYLISVKHI